MKWFNNLRMGVKFGRGFPGARIASRGVLGGLGYFNLNNVNKNHEEITDQRVPSVKNATAVERMPCGRYLMRSSTCWVPTIPE